jgi:hypothetical protein
VLDNTVRERGIGDGGASYFIINLSIASTTLKRNAPFNALVSIHAAISAAVAIVLGCISSCCSS